MIKQVIVVRTDLNMRKGKMSAQTAHASMVFLVDKIKKYKAIQSGIASRNISRYCNNDLELSEEENEWLYGPFTKIVVGVSSEEELLEIVEKAKINKLTVNTIIDSGKTEFNNVPTLTCAAIGPNSAEEIDKITSHLKLL